MSIDVPNFTALMVSRIARWFRAARRPWVVALGLVYLAGDLWCIAGRESWRWSVTGRLVHAVLFGPTARTILLRHDQVFVILPSSSDQEPRVLVPDEQSWDELSRLIEQPKTRVVSVFAGYAAPSKHIHARAITTTDWRVVVSDFGRNAALPPFEADRAIGAIREWNRTSEARLGLRPIDIDPKCVTTIHPLGVLHNALSLGVLVITLNALPSVTIGAWLRRRAARRIALGQCAACGYAFGAAAIDRCPECGQARARIDGTPSCAQKPTPRIRD